LHCALKHEAELQDLRRFQDLWLLTKS
jgi:hypothetical protein